MKKEIDPAKYGVMGLTGESIIVSALNLDMASLLGTEYTYIHYSPIINQAFKNEVQLSEEQIRLLNRISNLMISINSNSISELKDIYENNPQVQITKTFEPDLIKSEIPENNTEVKNTSINIQDVEFVNIPGGTFMMGSPVTEQGRKEDEIQHKVTLSAFKMSKYCITFAQYDVFCEATGRVKPWGFKRGNMPVSQITWYDAQAFAGWMGCRLPTEAEREYAARANTTTPFYTGDSLTLDQAYFNNDSGREAKPVGSFPPNAFGLYDMHGNMGEWCSDWYGEYNIDEKMNPKGPETGKIKIIRGGGFWLPAWRCRSACRNGDPPVNRGAGLSFRLVKDI
jgi:formylglycine-generating enzyme required for sulfatase activity